jgi:aldehyde dehydrogenase (NAD+)
MVRGAAVTLSSDPETLELPFSHIIGGEHVDEAGALEMRRPSDGRPYGACPVADEALVDRAVQTAKQALKTMGWADLLEKQAITLGRLEAVSSTGPIAQLIHGDIAVLPEQVRFFAEFADKEGSDVVPTSANTFGITLTKPYGVVGATTDWNVPLSWAEGREASDGGSSLAHRSPAGWRCSWSRHTGRSRAGH